MGDDSADLSGVPYSGAGVRARCPFADTCLALSRGQSGARAASEAAALALKKFERGMECEGGNVPEDEAERGKDVVSTRFGGGEAVLAEAVILRVDPPKIEMSAPAMNGISGSRVCDELVEFAAVSFTCCFPCCDLERAETKMVVCIGEVVGEVTPAIGIKSVAHEEGEEGLFAACRLVPLKAASFVLAGSSPEEGGLRKRDAHFLIADRRRMIHQNAEVSVYTEDRESEPKWTSMH